jgi:hypothetical protein
MTNDFYVHDDGYPAFNAAGASAQMRAQFDKIMAGFDRMPALTGNGNKLIWVKADGTSLEVISAFTDVTTYNASASAHGLLPKLSNDSATFLNGVGSWTAAPGQLVMKSSRTSNTILAGTDNAKLIDITSGTFTQTFTAAATLGNGWFAWIRNSGTGDITLDPNGAELIDGLASYIMYPGEVRLIQCDGSAFTSFVVHGFKRIFSANGSFIKPPGYAEFCGLVWSGAASGQRTNNLALASSGGAGGGCGDFRLPASAFGTSETITVGAGGTAISGVASGNVGNNSSIGTLFIVYAGSTATTGGSIRSGLVGVIPSSGGNIANPSGYEGGHSDTIASPTVWGGASPSNDGSSAVVPSATFGGAAGGSISSAGTIRPPGTSVIGGNGGAANTTTSGVDGVAPGGAGGATQTGAASGAGARGEVQIWGTV